uniref:Cofilin-2-like n=1 Tax=Callorhinchus milii TaxID=7868 RepID=A0A4W3HHX9_CALMI
AAPRFCNRLGAPPASGVQINGKVLSVFAEMKVHKTSEDVKKRKKFAIFKLNDEKTEIIYDEENVLLFGQMDEDTDGFQLLYDTLPTNDCRYAIFDVCYENKESKKKDLILLYWAPENASLKNRMIYASSLKKLSSSLGGVKLTWEVVGQDAYDRKELAAKLNQSVTNPQYFKLGKNDFFS